MRVKVTVTVEVEDTFSVSSTHKEHGNSLEEYFPSDARRATERAVRDTDRAMAERFETAQAVNGGFWKYREPLVN